MRTLMQAIALFCLSLSLLVLPPLTFNTDTAFAFDHNSNRNGNGKMNSRNDSAVRSGPRSSPGWRYATDDEINDMIGHTSIWTGYHPGPGGYINPKNGAFIVRNESGTRSMVGR